MKRRGPGRPPFLKRPRPITVKVEEEVYETLRRMAFSRGKFLSEFVREIIDDYLRREREG